MNEHSNEMRDASCLHNQVSLLRRRGLPR